MLQGSGNEPVIKRSLCETMPQIIRTKNSTAAIRPRPPMQHHWMTFHWESIFSSLSPLRRAFGRPLLEGR
jgi:hypothetical protein